MAKTKHITAKNPQITGLEPKTHVPEAIPEQQAPDPTSPPRKTKATLLRDMVCDPAGVSLQTLMLATGWQSHTIRAALSGLRKTGLEVTRTSGECGPIYTATLARDTSGKAKVAIITCASPREEADQKASKPETPLVATAGITSEVGDAVAPVSTSASGAGSNGTFESSGRVAS